jgi:hypothetical protein
MGLVPMSPNTTPSAPSTNAARNGGEWVEGADLEGDVVASGFVCTAESLRQVDKLRS